MDSPSTPILDGWTAPAGIAEVQHVSEDIGSSVGWFRSHVASMGRSIEPRSSLETAIGRCMELREAFLARATRRWDTVAQQLRWHGDAFGADFMTKLLHRAHRMGLRVPDHLWAALLDPAADVVLTRRGTPSQSRDFVWELLLGAACQLVATDVRFDEPDVTCKFGGSNVAIAAKVAYKPGNIWTNAVDRGFRQAAGRGELGLVAVDVVDILPLARWLKACDRWDGIPGTRRARRISRFAAAWCETKLAARTAMTNIAERFRRDPVTSGVLFFMPLLLVVDGQPGPYFYFHMPMTWNGAEGRDFEFVSALCQAGPTMLERVE